MFQSVCVLSDLLRRRSPDSVGLLWRRIVRSELSRCSDNVDSLSVAQRDAACDLLDWYIANFNSGYLWFGLYRSQAECDLRSSAAVLDWYTAHFSELSFRRRSQVFDLADWFFETYGYFKPEWLQIHKS